MSWRPKKRQMPNGTTVWVARYKDDRGRVRIAKPAWNGGKGTFKLRREAQRAINEAVTQRLPERQDTVGGYLAGWLDRHPRSVRTEKTYMGHVRAVLDLEVEGLPLREWDMRELRRRHASELVARMLREQGRAPGGARAILRALSAMAEDAITDELTEFNPWANVRVRDDDRRAVKAPRQPRVWSFEEMHRFAASAGIYEPAIRVLSDCGLRIGELLAVRRADLQDGLLHVRGSAWEGIVYGSSDEKNHDRVVPVPPGCMALLRGMPPRIDTEWLFPTVSGRLWRYSNFAR
jgi:integrase